MGTAGWCPHVGFVGLLLLRTFSQFGQCSALLPGPQPSPSEGLTKSQAEGRLGAFQASPEDVMMMVGTVPRPPPVSHSASWAVLESCGTLLVPALLEEGPVGHFARAFLSDSLIQEAWMAGPPAVSILF